MAQFHNTELNNAKLHLMEKFVQNIIKLLYQNFSKPPILRLYLEKKETKLTKIYEYIEFEFTHTFINIKNIRLCDKKSIIFYYLLLKINIFLLNKKKMK